MVSVPAAVPITPATDTSPAPPIVKPNPDPTTVLLAVNDNTPASLFILTPVLPKVIAPPYSLLPLTLRNAPALLNPVPFNVNASAPITTPPCNSNAAFVADTITPAAVVPKAVLF